MAKNRTENKTTDEFFDSKESLKFLRQNLEANLKVMAGEELDQDSKEMLMRTNLIMIRQCLNDFGVQ